MEEIYTAPYWNVLSNLLECNRAKFEEYIGDNCLEDFDSQYGIVWITGNQSSGKSTILNYMFDEKFPTKAKNKGQTTLGADMGHDYENRILLKVNIITK